MHVSSARDPVEIKWRDNLLSVARIFYCEYSLHAEGILFRKDCAVGSEVTVSVMRPIHTCGFTGPQGKLCKELGGLEGLRRTYTVSIQLVSYIFLLQIEQDILRADSFCNLNKISTCMIIQSWGFRLRLSPRFFFCVMCD